MHQKHRERKGEEEKEDWWWKLAFNAKISITVKQWIMEIVDKTVCNVQKIDFNFTAFSNGDEISEEHDLFQFIFPLQTHTYLHFASHYHADNVICIMQRHLENWSIESHGTAKWVRLHGNWLMCAHRRRRGFALPANLISLASESPNWMVLWLLHMLNDENSCSHLLQQHCW